MIIFNKKRMIHVVSFILIFTAGVLATGTSQGVYAVTYAKNFNESVLPSGTENPAANSWQIIKGQYAGPYTGIDVSQGFDEESNVSYSDDNSVRMQKNVIGTDIENEFLMYLNVEPQVSWEDILALNTIKVSNANKPVSPPSWPDAGHTNATFLPERKGDYQTPVQFRYYAIENGERIILAEATMYSNVPNVPKGGIGIGNPLLAPEGETFYADNNFNLKANGSGGISTAEIDISSLYSKYEFSRQSVYPKSVVDQLGSHIEVYTNSFNYDGGSYSYYSNSGRLKWTLPTNDLGLLPYKIDEYGNVTPSGVLRKLESGKYTYYRQDAYRLSYRFSLDVQSPDFVSCQSAGSLNDVNADYAVQTNISPGYKDDAVKGGMVSYSVGGEESTGHFNSPYIKGLLYTVEFKKVIKDSNVPIDGVKFEINRVNKNENTHSEAVSLWKEKESQSDGKVKFDNLPWGYYEVKEISVDEENVLVSKYIDFSGDSKLPKTVDAKDDVGGQYAAVGYVLQKERLEQGHIYKFKNGKVENEPHKASVTIKKLIENVEQTPDRIKESEYQISFESDKTDNGEAVYLYPGEADTELEVLDKNALLGDSESVEYKLIVPENGAKVNINEVIPEDLRKNIVFDNLTVEANEGSTDCNEPLLQDQEASLEIKPGNDIVITVRNKPIGRVYISKDIINFNQKLSDDEFMINIEAVDGQEMVTSTVLKHGETSDCVIIEEPTLLRLEEIVPEEYELDYMTAAVEEKTPVLIDGTLKVIPGENVIVKAHNKYSYKPYFHGFDTVMNSFKR